MTRYVAEVQDPAPIDSDGFLDLSPAPLWWPAARTAPTPVSELLEEAGGFVILAPPFAGKSTVMDHLSRSEPGAVVIDSRIETLDTIVARVRAAAQQGLPIYLDALDEAAITKPEIPRVVARALQELDVAEARWRIACRPYFWSPAIADAAASLTQGFRQLRLLPLDPDAIAVLVSGEGIDAEAFIQQIRAARLGRLAGTPGRLLSVARRWRESGQLLADEQEAIEYEIRALVDEPDGLRSGQPDLTTDRRLRLAGRLAAFAVFAGKPAFSTTIATSDEVQSADRLPSDAEPDASGTLVTAADYREVLGSALFQPGPSGSLVFAHRQYAEYLSARYIQQRQASRRAVRDLLAVHENGRIPREYAGVAMWLTALEPDLTEDLLHANALELARAGVELVSAQSRAALVEALLRRAATQDVDPVYGVDFRWLDHEGLSDRLRREIDGGIATPEQLWWVARLAVAGQCRALAPGLVAHALNAGWPDWARVQAVLAVGELGDEGVWDRLIPLLELPAEQDPDDAILGAALEVLYPRLLSTERLLAALRPRRNDHLLGGYVLLLRQLPDRVPEGDVAGVLRWLGDRPTGERGDLGGFHEAMAIRGWDLVDTPGTCEALGWMLARSLSDWRSEFRIAGHEPPWTDATDRRRRLLIAVAEHVSNQWRWPELLQLQLLQGRDAEWLIDTLPHLPATAKLTLAQCLPSLLGQPTYELALRISELEEDHPAFAATAYLRGSIDLDSDAARRLREAMPRDRPIRASPTPDETHRQVVGLLEDAEGDPGGWWRVLQALSVEADDGVDDHLLCHDFTRRSQWSMLSDTDRQRVITAGLAYLASHKLTPERWRGQRSIVVSETFPDWAGVMLMTTLVRHRPSLMAALDADVWERFASAIVGAWNFESNGERALRAALVAVMPPRSRVVLAEQAVQQLDLLTWGDASLACPELYQALIVDIAEAVAVRLTEDRVPPFAARPLLEALVMVRLDIGIETCHRIRDHREHRCRSDAARLLAAHHVEETVRHLLEDQVPTDDLVDFVPHLDINTLSTRELGSLLGVLLDAFPYSADPPDPSAVMPVDDRRRTREARGRILRELAERGADTDLTTLADGHGEPDRSILLRYAREARAAAADGGVVPLSPEEVLALLGRADARLVRSDADMLRVTLEALDEIQHSISAQNAFRDLWNDRDNGDFAPKVEDDISDWVQRQLRDILERRMIVDREVQVQRRGAGGLGTKFDIAVTGGSTAASGAIARVLVEAKRLDHPDLHTALEAQLVDRYLVPTRYEHGIYLVYWVRADQRPASWPSLPTDRAELIKALEQQAAALPDHVTVRPTLLDISRPRL